jgi:MFS family permease
MIGGVISHIHATENRNIPMAIFSGAAFVGTNLGPLVSGFIAQNTSWRWIYYVQAIMSFAFLILVAVLFKETRQCSTQTKSSCESTITTMRLKNRDFK